VEPLFIDERDAQIYPRQGEYLKQAMSIPIDSFGIHTSASSKTLSLLIL
jgi:hypothetical protein